MTKVFVFVSGLALANLPTSNPTQPIVLILPNSNPPHAMKAALGAPASASSNALTAFYAVSISKSCSTGVCPPSVFPPQELAHLPSLEKLAGSHQLRAGCDNPGNAQACRSNAGKNLLDGKVVLTGDWRLSVRTDCGAASFPEGLSTTGTNLWVSMTDHSKVWQGQASPRVAGDTFVFETEVSDLGQVTIAGLPGLTWKKSNPALCKRYGDGSGDCVLVHLRNSPTMMSNGRVDLHFAESYQPLASVPTADKIWLPWLESGDYCRDYPSVAVGGTAGAGHPRCLAGYVEQ